MATDTHIVSGIGYWAKVFEFNRDKTGYNNELVDIGGQTTIDVDLDDDGLKTYMKSGAQSRPKPSPDNEGMMRVKFKRKWTERYGGGEPEIYTHDGRKWDVETMGLIGNGSKVQVRYETYDTKFGPKGTRMTGIMVVDLVPYESDYDPASKPDFDFQAASSEPSKPAAPVKRAKLEEDADIPF